MITQWKYTEFNWSMKRAYHFERYPTRLQNRLWTFQTPMSTVENPVQTQQSKTSVRNFCLKKPWCHVICLGPESDHGEITIDQGIGWENSTVWGRTSLRTSLKPAPPPKKKRENNTKHNKTKQDSQATQPQVDWVTVSHNIPKLGTISSFAHNTITLEGSLKLIHWAWDTQRDNYTHSIT